MKLKVCEIFKSIQGESIYTGAPFHFIRLTGCNLRCSYCDTRYAYDQGRMMSIDSIVRKVDKDATRQVWITGGEPLLQENLPALITKLCECGMDVFVETNGSLSIRKVPKAASIVMDLKSPGSGHEKDNRYENISLLRKKDQVKMILCDQKDYKWARDVIASFNLHDRCPVILQPASQILDPALLAKWMLKDDLPARLGLQLHKIIWPDKDRGF